MNRCLRQAQRQAKEKIGETNACRARRNDCESETSLPSVLRAFLANLNVAHSEKPHRLGVPQKRKKIEKNAENRISPLLVRFFSRGHHMSFSYGEIFQRLFCVRRPFVSNLFFFALTLAMLAIFVAAFRLN